MIHGNPEHECNAITTQHSLGQILKFVASLNICFQMNEITYLLYQKLSEFTAMKVNTRFQDFWLVNILPVAKRSII